MSAHKSSHVASHKEDRRNSDKQNSITEINNHPSKVTKDTETLLNDNPVNTLIKQVEAEPNYKSSVNVMVRGIASKVRDLSDDRAAVLKYADDLLASTNSLINATLTEPQFTDTPTPGVTA